MISLENKHLRWTDLFKILYFFLEIFYTFNNRLFYILRKTLSFVTNN